MKIRIISSREEIPTLHANEKIVHLSFRPANLDFFAVVEACPKIEAIEIPKSYLYSISESSRAFLDMMKIELIEGEVWGHRVKTLEDGMLYAMMQAERVPALEEENRELKEKIKECEE